jgi:hypothetical protein
MPGSSHSGDLLTIEQIASCSIVQTRIRSRQNTPGLKRIMCGVRTGVIAPRLKASLG